MRVMTARSAIFLVAAVLAVLLPSIARAKLGGRLRAGIEKRSAGRKLDALSGKTIAVTRLLRTGLTDPAQHLDVPHFRAGILLKQDILSHQLLFELVYNAGELAEGLELHLTRDNLRRAPAPAAKLTHELEALRAEIERLRATGPSVKFLPAVGYQPAVQRFVEFDSVLTRLSDFATRAQSKAAR